MNNEHLIPPAVIDLCNSALDTKQPHHIRQNYIQRLEVTMAHIQRIIYQAGNLPKKK